MIFHPAMLVFEKVYLQLSTLHLHQDASRVTTSSLGGKSGDNSGCLQGEPPRLRQ